VFQPWLFKQANKTNKNYFLFTSKNRAFRWCPQTNPAWFWLLISKNFQGTAMRTVKPTRVFTSTQLQARRQACDPPADAVITAVYQDRGRGGVGQLMAFLGKRKPNAAATSTEGTPANQSLTTSFRPSQTNEQRIKAAIAGNALALQEGPGPDLPSIVQEFFSTHSQLPVWANLKRMAAGSAFLQTYIDSLVMLLGCYSLPYCYAAADGVQVLYMSQRIQKDTYNRLLETAQFVLEVGRPGAFGSDGTGFLACNKIRLMHAAIRFYTLHGSQWNPDWGQPINQEDMAGTNLAMSYIPIRGLRKINLNPGDEESEAYLHLWNVVGYLLGIQEELLPANLREAYHLDRLIAQRNMRTSEAGVALTKALMDSMAMSIPASMPKNLPASQMRLLLGDEIAAMLEIPTDDWATNLIKTTQIGNLFQHLIFSRT
jgi:hypothetical protein